MGWISLFWKDKFIYNIILRGIYINLFHVSSKHPVLVYEILIFRIKNKNILSNMFSWYSSKQPLTSFDVHTVTDKWLSFKLIIFFWIVSIYKEWCSKQWKCLRSEFFMLTTVAPRKWTRESLLSSEKLRECFFY